MKLSPLEIKRLLTEIENLRKELDELEKRIISSITTHSCIINEGKLKLGVRA